MYTEFATVLILVQWQELLPTMQCKGRDKVLTSSGGGSGMDVKWTLSGAEGEHFLRFWYIDSTKNGVKGAITCSKPSEPPRHKAFDGLSV